MKALLAVAGCVVAIAAGGPAQAQDRDTLFQVSTLGALQDGLYQPVMTIEHLRRHGDFGLGTFEGLDGEMIVDKGNVFQVPFSGRARLARDQQGTPFAAVTFFDADRRFTVRRTVDVAGLGNTIDRRIASPNYFYAIKVTGTFDSLQTRSVAKQTKPYPDLAAAVAGQRTFDLKNVKGTLVGIRCPRFVGSMNVPGYHWHFITKAGKAGGHVLSMSASDLRVTTDETRKWQVELPKTKPFGDAGLVAGS